MERQAEGGPRYDVAACKVRRGTDRGCQAAHGCAHTCSCIGGPFKAPVHRRRSSTRAHLRSMPGPRGLAPMSSAQSASSNTLWGSMPSLTSRSSGYRLQRAQRGRRAQLQGRTACQPLQGGRRAEAGGLDLCSAVTSQLQCAGHPLGGQAASMLSPCSGRAAPCGREISRH